MAEADGSHELRLEEDKKNAIARRISNEKEASLYEGPFDMSTPHWVIDGLDSLDPKMDTWIENVNTHMRLINCMPPLIAPTACG